MNHLARLPTALWLRKRLTGGIGLASSILPGVALALLAVDLLQRNCSRKWFIKLQLPMGLTYKIRLVGEVFWSGAGWRSPDQGGGLGLLRNVPFAGAMIGASSNAAMLYSLGYAACRFYEAKLDSPFG